MGGYHKADSPTPTSWVVRTTLDGPRDNKERKDLDAATGTGWADRINTAHSRVEEALALLPDLGQNETPDPHPLPSHRRSVPRHDACLGMPRCNGRDGTCVVHWRPR